MRRSALRVRILAALVLSGVWVVMFTCSDLFGFDLGMRVARVSIAGFGAFVLLYEGGFRGLDGLARWQTWVGMLVVMLVGESVARGIGGLYLGLAVRSPALLAAHGALWVYPVFLLILASRAVLWVYWWRNLGAVAWGRFRSV